ncbi:MAG: PEP-CTERM sorting domain-containing protein [Vicinamibacterales bacterium]
MLKSPQLGVIVAALTVFAPVPVAAAVPLPPASIPEPALLLLFAGGLVSVAARLRRRD